MVLLDPTDIIEAEGRHEITMVFKLIQAEPKVLALQLARGIEHERILAEMIATRRGLPGNDGDCTTIAAVAQTVLRRGGLDWFLAEDGTKVGVHLLAAAGALAALIAD